MRRKLFFSISLFFSFAFIFYTVGYPQGFGTVDEATAGNFFVVGARALGMGGAYTAVANDATALVYNPAGLARITRIEFSGTLTHQRINNRTDLGIGFNDGRFQNNTRFSSANLALPVPTYRGSLVFAFGVNRVKSFDKAMQFSSVLSGGGENAIETESGGLYLWSFGGAIDVSPNVSVGASLNLWSGKETYTWRYEKSTNSFTTIYDDAIKDRYSGFNAKFGVRIQPNKYLVIGGTIDSPVTYTIKEDWTQITETSEEYIQDYFSSEYKISLPFTLGAGLAFNVDNLILAGDISYTDWTQMEYKRLDDMAEANRQIKKTYTDAPRFHLGAEYLIPQISTWLRAGYYRNPLPYKDEFVKKNRNFFTAGVGFLIDQVMTLDIAWAHGSWELWDGSLSLTEKYTTNQIYLSTAYRF
jgi:long-subunit fatty acid transport protein